MDCRACPNSKCFIQKYCLPEWLDFTQLYKTSKYFSASKTILSEGELVSGIHVICSGKVKVLLRTDKGKEHLIRIAGKGQVLGHRGFSENMVYPISAKTLVESEIAYLPNEDFFKLIRANKDLSFYMMMFFANELMRSEQKLKVNVLKSSREKVAAAIVMVIEAFGYTSKDSGQVDLSMSFRELANFATVVYPTLSRVLMALGQEEILAAKKEQLFVRNESALRKLAGLEI